MQRIWKASLKLVTIPVLDCNWQHSVQCRALKMAPISAEAMSNPSSEQEKSNVIRFNVTKNELFRLDDGYKTLMRRQKGYFKIVTNTQNITSDAFTSSRVFVLAGPREKFTENEFDHLKRQALKKLKVKGLKSMTLLFVFLDTWKLAARF